jgi:phosphonate dehydrogenase
MAPKIVITNRVHEDVVNLLRTKCRVTMNSNLEPWSCQELTEQSRDATAMIAFMTDCIEPDFLAQCPNLRIIASVLKGFDNFDLDACTRKGVWLTVVSDHLTAPTAELTIGLMIAMSRHIVQGDAYVRRDYPGWRPIFYGHGLENSTVGILGMGAIGQAVARRLRAFDCRILYFDERPISPRQAASLGVRFSFFNELLRSTDFLVITLPLTERSKHLINRDAITEMKTGSYLINPARGSIVDEHAVAEAITTGKLAGYAADVFEMEDWARKDRPSSIPAPLLADRDHTILTPHLGSADWRARYAAEMQMAHSIIDYIAGRVPRGALNNPESKRGAKAC